MAWRGEQGVGQAVSLPNPRLPVAQFVFCVDSHHSHQPGELLDSLTAFASGDLRGLISSFMRAATTTWLRLCPDGEVTKVQIEKSSLISELGMQPRDFRVMENRASRKVRAWVSPGGV